MGFAPSVTPLLTLVNSGATEFVTFGEQVYLRPRHRTSIYWLTVAPNLCALEQRVFLMSKNTLGHPFCRPVPAGYRHATVIAGRAGANAHRRHVYDARKKREGEQRAME